MLQAGADIDKEDSVNFMQFGKKAVDRAKSIEMANLLKRYHEERKIGQKVNLSLPSTPIRETFKSKEESPTSQANSRFDSKRVSVSSNKSLNIRNPTPEKQNPSVSISSNFSHKSENDISNLVDIEQNLAEKWFRSIDSSLNQQLNQAIEVLQQELEALVNRSSRDLFKKLKEFVFRTIDELCSKKGYRILPTKLQIDHTENFEFKNSLLNVVNSSSKYRDEL